MGVYIYSLRADTKEIDGLTIGRVAFAYKIHSPWRGDPGYAHYMRREASTESLAETARYKNRDLDLVIVGDWKNIGEDREPTAVFRIDKKLTTYADTRSPGEVVGHLKRVGRKLHFEPIRELVEAGHPVAVAA